VRTVFERQGPRSRRIWKLPYSSSSRRVPDQTRSVLSVLGVEKKEMSCQRQAYLRSVPGRRRRARGMMIFGMDDRYMYLVVNNNNNDIPDTCAMSRWTRRSLGGGTRKLGEALGEKGLALLRLDLAII
jgi:hypothetical protein